MGFIFKMTANSACLLIPKALYLPETMLTEIRRTGELCHKSHNFAASLNIFERF